MGENYGVSFAQKLIQQGQFEDAIVAASKEIERDEENPEPLLDRAVALSAIERYLEAVTDLQKSMKLDEEAQLLETDFVDDTLFGALLGEARRTADVPSALQILARYNTIVPGGRHAADVDVWTRRLRGDDKDAIIVKETL